MQRLLSSRQRGS